MWQCYVNLLLLFMVLQLAFIRCENYTVGYLTNIRGSSNTKRQGLVISGAISLAINEINEEGLLGKHRLQLIYNDTLGETLRGTEVLLDQWKKNAIAFFGPEDSCEVEATIAAAVNLPMISYKCANPKVSDKNFYTTFARTYPSDIQVVRSVISLLKYYKWKRFSVICEDSPRYLTVLDSLELQATVNRMIVNTKSTFVNINQCQEERLPNCEQQFHNVIKNTYTKTRVYVMLGPMKEMIELMIVMKTKGLLENGEYVLVYISYETYTLAQSHNYLWRSDLLDNDARVAMQAAQSLLVIVPTPPTKENYTKFEDKVRLYNERPPFNFASPRPNLKKIFDPYDSMSIAWVGGKPPLDVPPCGYDGNECRPPPEMTRKLVAAILAVLLAVVIVVTSITYRNWVYEQQIAGLLWKIDARDLRKYGFNELFLSNSRASLLSQVSFESRMYGQVFTQTAMYKGSLVAVKPLVYNRKSVDIPREIKKEMKMMRELHHDNVNQFIGACIEPNRLVIVTEYCGRGSLQDILENDDIRLDNMFTASLIFDLIKGMTYLHQSEIRVHGNLKSSNCVVTARWVLKVTDFGLHEVRTNEENGSISEYEYYRNMLWKAPEILRDTSQYPRGSQKGDVYSFSIILHEIISRQGPFSGSIVIHPKEIVKNIVEYKGEDPFRPDISILECQDYILQTISECWHEKPENRPDFAHIRVKLQRMREGMKSNIMDNMMDMMEKYANNLEELVEERTAQLVEEKKKTEALLHRMLPKSVAEQLMRGEPVIPESFDAVTIYFSDIVGFTSMSAESSPMEVVTFLNDLYTVFDAIISHYNVYKVETIGDAYMVVSGLPIRNGDQHAGEIASMALELLDAIRSFRIRHRPNQTLKLRIGIHTGPVVAGVVGLTMPRYCLFGDTVNTASRMESNGEALKIHVSPQCKDFLDRLGGYIAEERGYVAMKGKGEIKTYWLLGHSCGFKRRRDPKDMILPQSLFSFVRETEFRRRSPKLPSADTSRRHSLRVDTRHLRTTDDVSNSNISAQGLPSYFYVVQDSPHSPRRSSPQILRNKFKKLKSQDQEDVSIDSSIDAMVSLEAANNTTSEREKHAPASQNGMISVDESDKPLLDSGGVRFEIRHPVNDDRKPHFQTPLMRTTSKPWRSYDEILQPNRPRSSLKDFFTGLLSGRLVDSDSKKISNSLINQCKSIPEQELEESVV
ncbi:receptor-type guanylate cyclase Gyc76C-like isoform X2 [Tachypleus tridentatus]|uniref:receptor-type guanylate cyclase Gyc76C-like isoform X2 n=1 Tax=Tachypleus tridentatus TaxID=6853 RepID=UPI003FD33EC5